MNLGTPELLTSRGLNLSHYTEIHRIFPRDCNPGFRDRENPEILETPHLGFRNRESQNLISLSKQYYFRGFGRLCTHRILNLSLV